MSDLQARITFPNLDAQLRKGVEQEIKKKLVRNMPKILNAIKSRMGIEVSKELKESTVYKEITLGGSLLGQLGLSNPSDLDDIIDAWANGIEVTYSLTKGKFGAINIGILESTYSDVLSLPQASYVSERSGLLVEWLRWLLLEGNAVLVKDYFFLDRSGVPGSRTGLGIMVESRSRNWSIPPRFAGTSGDNFATRALSDIDKVIDDIVRQEITKGIK